MTSEQRQVLVAVCETSDFPINTVEYPAYSSVARAWDTLKIVTLVEGYQQVDFYDREGSTVEHYVGRRE